MMRRIVAAFSLWPIIAMTCATAQHPTMAFSIDPQGSEGVSAILVNANGGNWVEGTANCGRSHLLEHVVGRKIDQKLRERETAAAGSVFAFTTLDRISIVVLTGDGSSGLRSAMDAIEAAIKTPVSNEIIEQERRLIEKEDIQYREFVQSYRPLSKIMSARDAAALAGFCDAPITFETSALRLESFDVSVISELAQEVILEDVDLLASNRERKVRAIGLSPTIKSGRAYFTPISANDLRNEKIISSLAFWHWVAKSQGRGAPRFVPLGALGYVTYLDVEISAAEIEELSAGFSNARSAEKNRFIRAGRTAFCAKKGRTISSVGDLAFEFATDEWALRATFNRFCQLTNTQLSAAINHSDETRPIALDTEGHVKSVSFAKAGSDYATLSICQVSEGFSDQFQGYYSSLLRQLVLAEFRFAKGMILAAREKSASKGCVAIEVNGLTVPMKNISQWLMTLGNKEKSPDYIFRVTHAHRAQCLHLPLKQRIAIGDHSCLENPNPQTLSIFANMLTSGSFEWK